MRMTPEEKKELDDWVQKEYPKSIKRMDASSPFHRIGKYFIGAGILLYALFVWTHLNFLKPTAIVSLLLGMGIEIVALVQYFKSLSHDD